MSEIFRRAFFDSPTSNIRRLQKLDIIIIIVVAAGADALRCNSNDPMYDGVYSFWGNENNHTADPYSPISVWSHLQQI